MSTDVSVELRNNAGVVDGRVSVVGSPLVYDVHGTVDAETNRIALLPIGWVGQDPGLMMPGLTATYDPVAGTLLGELRDVTVSVDTPGPAGAVSLSTNARPSHVAPTDLESSQRTVGATVTFAGTFRCETVVRDVVMVLTRGQDGFLSGTMTFDDGAGSTIGTFGIVGVESLVGNHITVLPVLWDEYLAPGPTYLRSFFVSGSVSGTDFTGTVYQSDGTVCMDDLFQVSVQ